MFRKSNTRSPTFWDDSDLAFPTRRTSGRISDMKPISDKDGDSSGAVAADKLRTALAGYFVGSRLPGRTDLAEQMGVSEFAARAAVKQLEAEGLLESRPRRGTVVVRRPRRSTSDIRRVRLLVLGSDHSLDYSVYTEDVILGVSEGCRRRRLPCDVVRGAVADLDAPGFVTFGTDTVWIVFPRTELGPSDELLLSWRTRGLRFLTLDWQPKTVHVNTVGRDIQATTYKATDHLLQLGHRRLAMVGRPRGPADVAALRMAGFVLAMKRHGAPIEPTHVLPREGPDGIEARLPGLLAADRGARPTGIVCGDQPMGGQVIGLCDEAGLKMPEDISVISGGARYRLPPPNVGQLSCFDEGRGMTLGQLAVRALLDSTDDHPVTVFTAATFIDRGSVGPPPR